MNPRKDKELHNIWLTRGELASIKASIEMLQKDCTSQELGWAMSNITEIIQESYERGDFK